MEPPRINGLLVCPVCLARLAQTESGLVCTGCSQAYSVSASGQPDLRAVGSRRVRLEYSYDPSWGVFPWEIVRLEFPGRPFPGVDKLALEATEAGILRSVPEASPGMRSLDLGCGNDHQRFREPLTVLGYDHTGVDIDGPAPDALADMHVLPFADASFDLLVSSAVFEHVKNPHVAMAEAARVAKPDALFVGTIAFSEPFHISYFHHSPLAVYELLTSCGFEIRTVVLSTEWNSFLAHLQMGYAGARYPVAVRHAIAGLLYRASMFPAMVKSVLRRTRTPIEHDRRSFARSHSALVGFVAVRRPRADETKCVRTAPDRAP
jgi:SAM-dependent methyltransferase